MLPTVTNPVLGNFSVYSSLPTQGYQAPLKEIPAVRSQTKPEYFHSAKTVTNHPKFNSLLDGLHSLLTKRLGESTPDKELLSTVIEHVLEEHSSRNYMFALYEILGEITDNVQARHNIETAADVLKRKIQPLWYLKLASVLPGNNIDTTPGLEQLNVDTFIKRLDFLLFLNEGLSELLKNDPTGMLTGFHHF